MLSFVLFQALSTPVQARDLYIPTTQELAALASLDLLEGEVGPIQRAPLCGRSPGAFHINPDGTRGGYVAGSATVDSTVWLHPEAAVCDRATVVDHVDVLVPAWIGDNAEVRNYISILPCEAATGESSATTCPSGFQVEVFGNAHVEHHVTLQASANQPTRIYGNAKMDLEGQALIRGSQVFGSASVSGGLVELSRVAGGHVSSTIKAGAQITGDPLILGGHVYGAIVMDNAELHGASVTKSGKDTPIVSGHAQVWYSDVTGRAVVTGDAVVSQASYVSGDALVQGNATVANDAYVQGSAVVEGHAVVSGSVTVDGGATIRGNAQVSNVWNINNCPPGVALTSWGTCARQDVMTLVTDNAVIEGNALVLDHTVVYQQAHIYEDAFVFNALVGGNADIHGFADVMNGAAVIDQGVVRDFGRVLSGALVMDSGIVGGTAVVTDGYIVSGTTALTSGVNGQ
jgi:carbonic anhydrase/acetyltransferase-like protein (isoleucine patch superfamily)